MFFLHRGDSSGLLSWLVRHDSSPSSRFTPQGLRDCGSSATSRRCHGLPTTQQRADGFFFFLVAAKFSSQRFFSRHPASGATIFSGFATIGAGCWASDHTHDHSLHEHSVFVVLMDRCVRIRSSVLYTAGSRIHRLQDMIVANPVELVKPLSDSLILAPDWIAKEQSPLTEKRTLI